MGEAMTTVAVACQGGGMHAAFEVGVLTEILNDVENKQFDLVGLSGTSAGALCTLIVWYGLARKNGKPGSAADARTQLNDFWDKFVASPGAEAVLNFLTYRVFRAEEMEVPGLGINAPLVAGVLNPYGALYQTVAAWLPHLYVRSEYFDLDGLLKKACPEFDFVEWQKVNTRLLIGASEVVNGLETVFDSNVNKDPQYENTGMLPNPKWKSAFWPGNGVWCLLGWPLLAESARARVFLSQGQSGDPRRTVDRTHQSAATSEGGGTQIQCGHRGP
jgi:NTE family protein